MVIFKKGGKMLSAERHSIILRELAKRGTITIDVLGNLLNVSDNTIRRDLSELQSKGQLERIQGGAVSVFRKEIPSGNISRRMMSQSVEKQSIAREAAKLIQTGKTYIIDAGTTTQYLIPYLTNADSITILTNSLDICNMPEPKTTSPVIACGGVLSHALHSFVGKPAEEFFESVNADILFLGAKGISEQGLSNENFFETPVKANMIKAADKVVLLADSSKFGRNGLSLFGKLSDIDLLITDKNVDSRFVDFLRNQKITVVIAQ